MGLDIGIYTLPEVLADKLGQRDAARRAEGTWNMRRLPRELGKGATPDRLFVACQGAWRGFFRIVPEVLFVPEDTEKPYSLIFDLNSWRDIAPTPVLRFRGFRYLHDMPV
jgi:hypothetical protein